MEYKSKQNIFQEKINLYNCQEYYLIKENAVYKFLIEKNNEEIFIKCKNYLISLSYKDLSILTNIKFNSINKAYEFIFNYFEENKIIIKNIKINKEIILLIKNNEKEIEFSLKYNTNNNSSLIDIKPINEIINLKEENKILKNEIIKLKEENKKIKNEIDKLKKLHNNNNPKDIKLISNIPNDSYADDDLNNSFVVFKSINEILYLIYADKNKSIICYDLNENKNIKILKNYYNHYITNFRHYLDKINKRDLVMSISEKENNIRIWNANNWECILNIANIYDKGFIDSSCFLNYINDIYIITSNANFGNASPIKIYDFNKKLIKEIKNSNNDTFFIDTYYDNILSKIYIITGNKYFSRSYDYEENNKYHEYNDNNINDDYGIFSIIIKNNKNIIKIIESCSDGIIRIFNFHSGLLLNKIKIGDYFLYGMCLWSDNYLFVGCQDNTIKIVEIKNGLIIKSLNNHNNGVITIKKIIHPKYGECLISQNYKESEIKLWINSN